VADPERTAIGSELDPVAAAGAVRDARSAVTRSTLEAEG